MIARRTTPAPPAPADRVHRYRHNRNYVAVGDLVHVSRTPGHRRGFDGRVVDIRIRLGAGETTTATGIATAADVRHVDVVDPATGGIRSVAPRSISRRAQSKAPTR